MSSSIKGHHTLNLINPPMPKKILISIGYTGTFFSADFKRLYHNATETVPRAKTWSLYCVPRDDPLLISIVEQIGCKKAAGVLSVFKIVEIPDDVTEWEIVEDEYGTEMVAEKCRRTWG